MYFFISKIIGLQDGAPVRITKVPGNIPLVVFHDQVLCPSFQWTKGYHDYCFALSSLAYRDLPPSILILVVIFEANSKNCLVSCIRKHGFYGTLRNSKDTLTVSDTVVYVAGFLYWPKHRLVIFSGVHKLLQ